MDAQTPVMNGHDATRAIRALEREDAATVPILAMTANAFSEDAAHARAVGMNGHVAKPIDIKELFGQLATCLNAQKPAAYPRGK